MIVLESGNEIIQLKSPDFHTEVRDIKVRVKRTMDNTFRTNINTPCVPIFSVPILMLSVTKRRELESFLAAVAGFVIKFTDKRGDIHITRLTNTVDIQQDDQAQYSATLELEEVF